MKDPIASERRVTATRSLCWIRLGPIAIALAAITATAAAGENDCRLFLLRDSDGQLVLDEIELTGSPRTERVFHANADTGIIDVILPVGPGGSGSMARLADDLAITAVCDAGTLTLNTHTAGGKGYARPPRSRADLAQYDVRLSVSAGDGRFANFLIERYATARRDDVGPVLDIFAGRMPVTAGDFVLFTDTFLHALPAALDGETPIELDRWPIATVRLPDGRTGAFIVDIGAGTTVVSRSFLPEGTKIKKQGMVQYSSAGREVLKYAPGGATGQVQTVLGQAVLPEMQIGQIRVEQMPVDVLSQMPDFFGRPIDGIIGLDLLRQSSVLSFVFDPGPKPKARMHLARHRSTNDQQAIELPFTFVNSHLVVNGQISNHRVYFTLDTGSPDSMLAVSAARRVGLQFDETSRKDGRGLDGGSAAVYKGRSTALLLGGRSIPDTTFHVGALPIFDRMTVHDQNVGLLGTAFFAGFARVEIDFNQRVLRLITRS